jgi:hypothetical protein
MVVNLCFITRHANKLFANSLKNWGPLSETISNGVPNQIKTHSYKNYVTFLFINDFKACIFANLMR